MKLLVINNAGFIKDNQSTYITKTTGVFLEKLNDYFSVKTELFQFEQKANVKTGINDFKLSEDKFIINSVPYHTGKIKLYSYILALFKIIAIISQTDKFIYIFYPGHIPLIAAYVCIIFNKPYGLYVRGEYNVFFSKKIFKNARFINTVGTIFKNQILKFNTNCQLIKPMVQFDFSIEPQFDLVSKKNEILYVGRVEARKGVWDIINAAKEIRLHHPGYKIRLIGSGLDFEKIHDFIYENKIDNVILHGPVFNTKELEFFYLESKVFLFPSHDEGFPRVLYEAMHFRLPIITTFVGNIPGVMKHDCNCLKIETCSPNSINEMTNRLISDDQLKEKLIDNGKKTLSDFFNSDIIPHQDLIIKQLRGLDG